MMPMKLPPANVLRVSALVMYSSYSRRCRLDSRHRICHQKPNRFGSEIDVSHMKF